MKKLLLAFSLIAAFGLGITATSITIPPNDSIEFQDGDDKKEKKKKSSKCNDKSSTDKTEQKPTCCSKAKTSCSSKKD